MANKIKWEGADFKWNLAPPSEDYKEGFKASVVPYTWDDVALIEELVEAVDVGEVGTSGLGTETALEALPDEKKKRVIQLVMRRRGIKMYDEVKEVKNITAHVESVEMIIKEVKAKMLVENINV
tara:strand:- start:7717 stop:8088 length:372 start_codon:yes stop_codon:yes gene_type:complete